MTASLAPERASSSDFPILVPERPEDERLVSGLIDRAFGPGRLAKAAERLREHNRPLLDLSFAAWADGRLAGCVRMWPVHIGAAPAVFLGPFAVEPEFRGLGLGAALIRQACDAARAAGHDLVLLVGDTAYFEPLGFQKVAPGAIVLPGPANPARVLTLALTLGADAELAGPVTAG